MQAAGTLDLSDAWQVEQDTSHGDTYPSVEEAKDTNYLFV